MKNLSISGLAAGVLLVLTYSLVPTFFNVLTEPPKWLSQKPYADPWWAITLMFTAASLASLTIARVTNQPAPRRVHIGTAFALGIAGCLAAVYFIVVKILGAAMADWLEKAFLPIFVIILGLSLEKEHPPSHKLVGTVISLIGVTLFFFPLIKKLVGESYQLVGLLFPTIGALGSAFSVILMGRLAHRHGVGRFYAMAIRYGTPAILILVAAPFIGDVTKLTTMGFLCSIFVGSVLVNATLYFALVTLKELGATSLGVFLILIPVMTTFWRWCIYGNMEADFFRGAVLILLGTIVCEFGWRWLKRKKKP